jgi:sugar phosphate isomerase/epimerase
MIKLSMMSSVAGRVSAQEVVNKAIECGFDAVEWITGHGSNGKRLRKLVSDVNLEISAYTMYDESFVQRDSNYLERFKENLEIAVEANAPLMMIPPFGIINQTDLKAGRQEWIKYFAEVYPLAQNANMPLALESTGLADSPITSADEIFEVLNNVPGMKLVFDNGNISTADEPLSAFKRLQPWIIHVHFKDNIISDVNKDGFLVRRNGKYMRSVAIGKGCQDLRSIYKMLKADQYDKYITLESSDPDRIIPIAKVLKENIRLISIWDKEYSNG